MASCTPEIDEMPKDQPIKGEKTAPKFEEITAFGSRKSGSFHNDQAFNSRNETKEREHTFKGGKVNDRDRRKLADPDDGGQEKAYLEISDQNNEEDRNRRERKGYKKRRRSDKYEKRNRAIITDPREPADWKYMKERVPRRRKYQATQEYNDLGERSSEEEDSFSNSGSEDSEVSSTERSMEDGTEWGSRDWEKREIRSRRGTRVRKDARYHNGERGRSGKRHKYDQGRDRVNSNSPFGEIRGVRPSRRHTSSPNNPTSIKLFEELLHGQDMMLTKLDSVVSLLRKAVRALTSSQNHVSYRPSSHENGPTHPPKRAREPMYDSDNAMINHDARHSEKNLRQRWAKNDAFEMDSNIRRLSRDSSYAEAWRIIPEKTTDVENTNKTRWYKEDLQPKISSYYSVRSNSTESKQKESYLYTHRMTNANDLKKNSPNSTASRQQIISEATSPHCEKDVTDAQQRGNRFAVSPTPMVSGINILSHMSEKQQVVSSEDPVQIEEGEEIQPLIIPSDLQINRDIAEPQRNLKLDNRPSMVDLSQTNNILMSQKYYALSASEGYSQGNQFFEQNELNGDSVYGEETIPCVLPGQPWDEDKKSTKNLKSPFDGDTTPRRRTSLEPTPWLARTFTAGSGQEGRNFVTKGKGANGIKHDVGMTRRGESTDNKKMMSSITHLALSTINVASEIVQILVATPSDHNNDRDAPRKALERVLNQSLALMGCLPMVAEIDLSVVQKIYHGSKNCMTFIYRLMDHCYTRDELMKCRVAGGVRKYRGNNTETEQLCPKRLRTILKLAKDLYPNEYAQLSKANMIRNNINMKCRKTVIRDVTENE